VLESVWVKLFSSVGSVSGEIVVGVVFLFSPVGVFKGVGLLLRLSS